MGVQNFNFATYLLKVVFWSQILHCWTKIFQQFSNSPKFRGGGNSPYCPCHSATVWVNSTAVLHEYLHSLSVAIRLYIDCLCEGSQVDTYWSQACVPVWTVSYNMRPQDRPQVPCHETTYQW